MRLGTSKPKAFLPPHRQHQLSFMVLLSTMLLPANDCAVLSRVGPDAGDRPAAVPGVHLLNLQLLPCGTKRATPKSWWRTFLYMPFVMATGIGISVRNAQAVIEAIIGKKSEFARTPKYKIEGKQDSFRNQKIQEQSRLDALCGSPARRSTSFSPCSTPSSTKNYATVPFCCSSCGGISTPASLSLGQTYFAHLRFGVNAPEMRPASSGAPGF